jgi:HAE1 family hydrophobic/amphiphilic exporter-1
MSQWFDGILRRALKRPGLVLGTATALFLVTLAAVPRIGKELVPPLQEGEFHYEVVLPEGTPLKVTDRTISGMEAAAAAEPGVALTYAMIGSRLVAGGASMKTKDENLGQIDVVLADRSDSRGERKISEALRDRFSRMPGVSSKLGRPSFFSLQTPVEVVFYGEDLEALREYTLGLLPDLTKVRGLADVRASLEAGNPELTVRFDRDRLAAQGLSLEEVSGRLRDRVQGAIVSRFREEDRHLDIRVRNRMQDRNSIAAVQNLVVAERNGVPVTLAAVADVEPARGPAEIHRVQQSRAAIVTGEVTGRSLGAVTADIQRAVENHPPPPGISVNFAGQNEEMSRSLRSLAFAFALAIFLVYLVMASTFENLIHPFIILFTIPLGLIGVVIALLLGHFTINVMSLIGVILLVGIVVNNAIVLIDAVNRFRQMGLDKIEALVRAAHVRMRPILMTTLATVLGLLPMAISFGEGSELRQPLAVVVSLGLMTGTLLTLLVIPAMYLVVPSRVRTLAEEEDLRAAEAEAERLGHGGAPMPGTHPTGGAR